jgi:hypothetical protein
MKRKRSVSLSSLPVSPFHPPSNYLPLRTASESPLLPLSSSPPLEAKGTKHVMEEDNEAIAKRAKTDAGSGEADVRALWEKGQLEKLTVGILKGFLRRMGFSVKGKKADLLKRCEEYFNGEGVNTAE